MKKIFILFLSVLAFTFSQGQSWDVDFAHSSVNFSVNHFFTPVTGKFNTFSGNLSFDVENPVNSVVDFTAEVASVSTQEEKRDKHLQSGDFFDAKKFPTMKFVANKVEKTGDKTYKAYGKLTIKDVTKDVVIPFVVLGIGDHPMKKGNEMIGIKSEFTLNRNDYGVGTGSWAATMVVGDEVDVKIIFEASRKKNI